MVPAGGNERGLVAITLHQFETEHATIETERSFEIGDLKMDVSDPRSGGYQCIGHALSLTWRRTAGDRHMIAAALPSRCRSRGMLEIVQYKVRGQIKSGKPVVSNVVVSAAP
jgi:hypothetical protein